MKKIVCIGDSNTYGFDPCSFYGIPYERPWPAELERLTGWKTANHGINGVELPHTPLRREVMLQNLRTDEPFDAAIVMLGTNDILNAYVPDMEKICKDLDQLLNSLQIRYPSVQLLLLVPPVLKTEYPIQESASAQLAGVYQQLAHKYGAAYADCNSIDLEMTYDGVHLSRRDHLRIAGMLAASMKFQHGNI